MSKIDINDFEVEKECVYQGEKYCVRDNYSFSDTFEIDFWDV